MQRKFHTHNAGLKLKYSNGLSCVLVNDERFLLIINKLNLELKEVTFDPIVNGNGQLRYPYNIIKMKCGIKLWKLRQMVISNG